MVVNNQNDHTFEPPGKKSRFGLRPILGLAALVILMTALVTVWWVNRYIYASEFTPTVLTATERRVLDSKLATLDTVAQKDPVTSKQKRQDQGPPLEPEAYSEKGAKRELNLTEKEVNALIATNPRVAQRVAIDLSDNLVSIKLVVPMDEEIPLLGGKTLRLNMGVQLGYANGRPVVALKGVSLGGIPLPNAWLGNLKNKNVVQEFGTESGFWKVFSDGVADLKVHEGHIRITLRE